MYKIKVKLDEGAIMPKRAHDVDAGMDLFCPMDGQPRYVKPHDSLIIDTGVHMSIPRGFYGRIASKSGLNIKYDLVTEGVVDAGYTGSIQVKIYNHGNVCRKIDPGDKITQIIIESCLLFDCQEVDELPKSDRGDNGFGSTGK